MKIVKALKFYLNKPLLNRAKPDVARLRALSSDGFKIRYTTAENKIKTIPTRLFPTTRIIGNLTEQGYSLKAFDQAISYIKNQYDNGILKPENTIDLMKYLQGKGVSVVICGAQYGDEGKGRASQLLVPRIGAKAVVRFSGGPNAGKVVRTDNGKTFEFCMLPAGAIDPEVKVYMGQGTNLNLDYLLAEIEDVEKNYIKIRSRMFIDDNCNLILPYHEILSWAKNEARGKDGTFSHGNTGMAEGSTGMGVGGAMGSNVNRRGIRVRDLFGDPKKLLEKIQREVTLHEMLINGNLDKESIERNKDNKLVKEFLRNGSFSFGDAFAGKLCDYLLRQAKEIRPMRADVGRKIEEDILSGGKVVFEGTQAALLDISWGQYPMNVTSTRTTPNAVSDGAKFDNKYSNGIMNLGVVKTYLAVRGKIKLPTELMNGNGEQLREAGNEYEVAYDTDENGRLMPKYDKNGALVYNKRKKIAVGWQDAMALAECAKTGFTHFMLTKLDVLDGFKEIKIATGYEYKGPQTLDPSVYDIDNKTAGKAIIHSYVTDPEILKYCEPIYEVLPGWMSKTSGIRRFEDLPVQAQNYVKRLEEILGKPIILVSVGPKTDQYIERKY
jgi:adenylosuccinate synthase